MGASDATEAIGLTKDLQTKHTYDIPAGAHVLYSGGSNGHGHSVVSDGGGYVYTVDWYPGLNITRVRQSDMENAWGNLRWGGWSKFYGDQPLDIVGDDPDPKPPTPEPEDDVPSYVNAAGKDVTLADGSGWQSVYWDDAWGTDIRTSDKKGFDLPKSAFYSMDVSVSFDPAEAANLLMRAAFYQGEEDGWWYGGVKEFFATSGSTSTGYTFNGQFRDGAFKVQIKPNGGGKVAVSGLGIRGLYWKP
jgi:hypothetical protein